MIAKENTLCIDQLLAAGTVERNGTESTRISGKERPRKGGFFLCHGECEVVSGLRQRASGGASSSPTVRGALASWDLRLDSLGLIAGSPEERPKEVCAGGGPVAAVSPSLEA